MFETPGFSAAVRQYVLESAPVLALILDASGRVVKANVQALRLLGKDTVGRLLTEKLADPTQVFDVAALTGSDAPALFTFVTVSRMPESLYFRFFSHSGSIFALGSMDFEEQQKLFGELTALNGELNGLTRKLQQANAELRELNELKTRHARQAQEHMESMRLQGLASLNLMEDALEARKRAEQAIQALRESEAQFRDLVEGAPDAIFVQVGDRFAYVNPAAHAPVWSRLARANPWRTGAGLTRSGFSRLRRRAGPEDSRCPRAAAGGGVGLFDFGWAESPD